MQYTMAITEPKTPESCSICLQALNDHNRFFFKPCCHYAACVQCHGLIPHPKTCPVCREPYVPYLEWDEVFASAVRLGESFKVDTIFQFGLLSEERQDAITNHSSYMHNACRKGYTALVKTLIRIGINPQIPHPAKGGISPIYIACEKGHLDIVKVLSNYYNNDIDDMMQLTTGCNCNTALYSSRANRDKEGEQHDASCERRGYSPFYVACETGHVDIILYYLDELHMDIKQSHGYGLPLIGAQEAKNREEVISLLVEKGANVNQYAGSGLTPLYHACSEGNLEVIKILINNHADINLPEINSQHKRLPFWTVCKWERVDVAKYLLDEKLVDVNKPVDKNGIYPLHAACSRPEGGLEITTLLLEYGADLNCTGNQYKNTPFLDCCCNGNLEVARCYLERHANVSLLDNEGNTPFMMACAFGRFNIIKHLWSLRDHFDFNFGQPDKYGITPFAEVCVEEAGVHEPTLSILKFLYENGFDYLSSSTLGIDNIGGGKTPLHHACYGKKTKIVKYLLTLPNIETICNKVDDNGASPLWLACKYGRLKTVKVLTKYAAVDFKLEIPDINGYTPLHIAIIMGHDDIVKYLLTLNVSISTYSHEKIQHTIQRYNPILSACYTGHEDILEMLLNSIGKEDTNSEKYDCVTEASTHYGDTACIIACDYGWLKTVKKLVDIFQYVSTYEADGRPRVVEGYNKLLHQWLNRTNQGGYTGFHAVCLRGRHSIVKYLMNIKEVDKILPNRHGHTPAQTVAEQINKFNAQMHECWLSQETLAERQHIEKLMEKHQAYKDILTLMKERGIPVEFKKLKKCERNVTDNEVLECYKNFMGVFANEE